MSGASSLQLQSVTVCLANEEIVSEATFTLNPGKLVAIVGPNGAGKTTLLRAIAGLTGSTGHIILGDSAIKDLSRSERARKIAYLPQGHQVHWPMTARDIVALGRYPHGLEDPLELDGTHKNSAHAKAVEAAMLRTETIAFKDRPIMSLSGGERARVMLARVLAVEAKLLLADEPTASLDPRHQITVMQDLLNESRNGALVVVVTHDIWLASRLADEIVLMDQGRVVAHGVPHDVLSDARLADVYGINVRRMMIDGETLLAPWGLA
jgi:iron complex transport system ATP-binding protein